ncbi:MAG: TlpA family protein disulfide reductase [Chitinophagaceae bacterium]
MMNYLKNLLKKNGSNLLLLSIALVFLFNTDAKAWVLRGVMDLGFFQVAPKNESPIRPPQSSPVSFVGKSGQRIYLSDLKGKVVFLNFWATWCPPCRAEMPSINSLYQKFKEDPKVVFMEVDVDGNFPKSQRYLTSRGFDLPLYIMDQPIPAEWFRGAIPTTIILDTQGNMVQKHEGMADYNSSKVVDYLKSL